MHTPLVPQIHKLSNRQPLTLLIAQDDTSRSFGLANYICSARVVEETIMDARGIPRVHPLGAAERCIADERMAATIVVASVKVSAVVIFFRPIQLIVGESRVVEAAKETQHMRIIVQVSEVIAMVFQVSGFVPAFGYTRGVLPFVEELQVFGGLPVYDFEGEVLVYFGDVAGVADALGSGLGAADGMAGVNAFGRELHGEVVVLGHDRIVGKRRAHLLVDTVAEDPDGAGTSWGCGALPEGAAEDEEFGGARDGVVGEVPGFGVFDGEAGG